MTTHKQVRSTEEALTLALEALTIADNIALVGAAYTPRSIDLGLQKISSAITAIKEALAQPKLCNPSKRCDMTKEREALKLALEALENTTPTGFNMESDKRFYAAITAIKEALAQPAVAEQHKHSATHGEPVAWYHTEDYKTHFTTAPSPDMIENGYWQPLYTTPPQRKPLTDEQRNWIVATCPTPRHIIDTVEKMHGIKGEA